MKKLSNIALILFIGFTSACKKSKEDPNGSGGLATVTASAYGFDGSSSLGKFSSTKAGITQTTLAGITTFTISAIKDGSKESITIILFKKAAVGKTTIGSSLDNGGIELSKDYTKPADLELRYSTDNNGRMQGGGEVNITKVDGNYVEGTFYAVAYNNSKKEAFAEQGTFKGNIK